MLLPEDEAFQMIRRHALTLKNTCETYGMVNAESGWQLTRAAKDHPELFYALLKVAHDMFQLANCVAGKIGRGVSHTSGHVGCDQSILIWWPCSNPELYRSMTCSAKANINLKELFGEDCWLDCCWIRLFNTDDDNNHTIHRLAPDIPYLGANPNHARRPPDAPTPATPIPMEEDDATLTNDTTDTMSTATRIVTPMSTDKGPPPPPAPHGRAPPITTTSSRSRSRHAPSTQHSILSHRSTISPVLSTDSTNRATTATNITPHIDSPRGDKRTSVKTGSSDTSLTHVHKEPRTNQYDRSTASSSTQPNTHATHEPLLPIDDNEDDDDATIAQDETDTETALHAEFREIVVDTKFCEQDMESNAYLETWEVAAISEPPVDYHSWERYPGIQEICDSQEAYLSNAITCKEHLPIRSSAESEDLPELEVGPYMAALFVGSPTLQEDEILVFKTVNKAGKKETSVQIEKNFDALTPAEIKLHSKLVDEAIRKEIQSFVEHKTFARAWRKDCKNVCTSRWVLRWKEVDGKRIIKARLTIRGFQDTADVQSFASTASRWGQRIIVSLSVLFGWNLWIADVSTAFLRGMDFSELSQLTNTEERDVAFLPPRGSERFFTELEGMHDLNFQTEVLRLLKAVYGLRDAPRAWRIRLDLELVKLGGKSLYTDKSLYAFHDSTGKLEALLSTHVDDIKGCGTKTRVEQILKGLEKAFGKLKLQSIDENGSFEHCGLRHEKYPSGGIRVHQDHYATQLRLVDVSSLKIDEPDQLLTEAFVSSYLSLLGGLSWLIQTRCDIAIYVVALQRAAKRATVGHLLKLNKLARWVRRRKYALVYKPIKAPLKLLNITDAAFKTEPNSCLAMRGAVIGISEVREGTQNRGGIFHIIEFSSRKQRRICRSTYAAELNAMADSLEITRLIAMTLSSCLHPYPDAKTLQQAEDNGQLAVPIEVCTDCRSVFDSLRATDTKVPTESSLILILSSIKQLLQAHVVKWLSWINTHDMLADGMTKGGVSRKALFQLSQTGAWTMQHESMTFTETNVVPIR